ncbi:MAG: SPOR domain-containing protein, partial [Bacteroidota bacterium]
GKKTPAQQAVEETLPPVVQPPPQIEEGITPGEPTPSESLAQRTEEMPTPTVTPGKEEITTPPSLEKKEVATTPPAGTGNYTVQVSSWPTRSDADRVVNRLSKSGFDAYVAEGFVKGRKWFRVRVGRYATSADAQAAATKLMSVNENGVWITKVE